MNTNTIEKNWSEIRTKIKAQWSKMSDEQIDGVKSDLSLLPARIQTAHSLGKEEAERQFGDFKKSVQSLIGDDAAAKEEPSKPATKPVTQNS